MMQEIKQQQVSICAWCRHEYDDETGERGRYLTNAEYAEIESHGCCRICARAMLAESGDEFNRKFANFSWHPSRYDIDGENYDD